MRPCIKYNIYQTCSAFFTISKALPTRCSQLSARASAWRGWLREIVFASPKEETLKRPLFQSQVPSPVPQVYDVGVKVGSCVCRTCVFCMIRNCVANVQNVQSCTIYLDVEYVSSYLCHFHLVEIKPFDCARAIYVLLSWLGNKPSVLIISHGNCIIDVG